jgi:hypothetical protein
MRLCICPFVFFRGGRGSVLSALNVAASCAQGLQIIYIIRKIQASPVWFDVVHGGGWLAASYAVGIAHQVSGTQALPLCRLPDPGVVYLCVVGVPSLGGVLLCFPVLLCLVGAMGEAEVPWRVDYGQASRERTKGLLHLVSLDILSQAADVSPIKCQDPCGGAPATGHTLAFSGLR